MEEQQIKALSDLCQAHRDGCQKVVRGRFDAMDCANKIQTKEFERRLDFLNGEAERLRQMQATYLPREVYETRMDAMQTRLRDLENFRANLQGRFTVIAVMVSAGVSIIILIINYLWLGAG